MLRSSGTGWGRPAVAHKLPGESPEVEIPFSPGTTTTFNDFLPVVFRDEETADGKSETLIAGTGVLVAQSPEGAGLVQFVDRHRGRSTRVALVRDSGSLKSWPAASGRASAGPPPA